MNKVSLGPYIGSSFEIRIDNVYGGLVLFYAYAQRCFKVGIRTTGVVIPPKWASLEFKEGGSVEDIGKTLSEAL